MNATGLIERDYSSHPSGYMACAPSAPDDWLLSDKEVAELLAIQQANNASLWDIREKYYQYLKSLNQNPHPLCWAFSTTKSAMYEYATMGTPVILSPWWTAGISNGWRDEGGWGAQSTQGLAEIGALTMDVCPRFSSSYATAENKALAAKRKVIEWYDGSQSRDKNRSIMLTAFAIGKAPVLDFNDIGHSMNGCRLVSIDPLEVWCDNSWDAINQYGPKGIYIRKGRAAIPDGIVVPRVIQPVE